MLIEFANTNLERLYSDPDYFEKGYHQEIIDKYIKAVLLIQVVNDIRQIYERRWLYCKKLWWWDLYSIRLNKQRRLLFTLITGNQINIVRIEEISKHYE